MADAIIPEPDAAGYFHYTYIVTDIDGRWYGGKHSTQRHPFSDAYLGSGNWVRTHPNRERLRREIVGFFPSSKAVYVAEAEMVTWAIVRSNALCMNLWAGGRGITVEAAQHRKADLEWRDNNLAGIRRRSASPKWQANQIIGAAKRLADPKWRDANNAAARLRSNDPKWIESHDAAMQIMHADPEYRASFLAGIGRSKADPSWPAAHAVGIANRANNPQGRKNQADATRRVTKTSEWKAAQGAGSRDRATVLIDHNGKRMTVADACRETGTPYKMVLKRKKRGWPESRWFTPSARRQRRHRMVQAAAQP